MFVALRLLGCSSPRDTLNFTILRTMITLPLIVGEAVGVSTITITRLERGEESLPRTVADTVRSKLQL
jgi:hypothetical protein